MDPKLGNWADPKFKREFVERCFRIVDEYARQDADAPYVGEDLTVSMQLGGEHYKIEPYVHLTYECRPRGLQEPSVRVSSSPALFAGS